MKKTLLLTILLGLLFCGVSFSEEKKMLGLTSQEKTIITKVLLTYKTQDKLLIIVEPKTKMENDRRALNYVKKGFRAQGHRFETVVDRLFKRNRESVVIDISSDKTQGYVFSGDIQVEKDLKNDNNVQDVLKKDQPYSDAIYSLSIPVYDDKAGIVLIYEEMAGWDGGIQRILAYKYDGNKLECIAAVMLSIS
jgi:hypothetical protein